jgi:hypothetical protein
MQTRDIVLLLRGLLADERRFRAVSVCQASRGFPLMTPPACRFFLVAPGLKICVKFAEFFTLPHSQVVDLFDCRSYPMCFEIRHSPQFFFS